MYARSSLVVLGVALSSVACGGAQRSTRTQIETVVIPDSFVRPSNGRAQLAPVARGTISLGTVETGTSLPTRPNATGGGPPVERPPPSGAGQTSVGPVSPTTVTGADSPLDSSPTATPIGGQVGNPLSTGTTTVGGGQPTR